MQRSRLGGLPAHRPAAACMCQGSMQSRSNRCLEPAFKKHAGSGMPASPKPMARSPLTCSTMLCAPPASNRITSMRAAPPAAVMIGLAWPPASIVSRQMVDGARPSRAWRHFPSGSKSPHSKAYHRRSRSRHAGCAPPRGARRTWFLLAGNIPLLSPEEVPASVCRKGKP